MDIYILDKISMEENIKNKTFIRIYVEGLLNTNRSKGYIVQKNIGNMIIGLDGGVNHGKNCSY